MVKEPYVHYIPILTGGIGYASDTKCVRISRTIRNDQVVDELVLSFTDDIEIPAMGSRDFSYSTIH